MCHGIKSEEQSLTVEKCRNGEAFLIVGKTCVSSVLFLFTLVVIGGRNIKLLSIRREMSFPVFALGGTLVELELPKTVKLNYGSGSVFYRI